MRKILTIFIAWIPLAVAITGICLLIYATVQQNYSQSLNDPQIQMAEDVAHALSGYARPQDVISTSTIIDIREDLKPWMGVYDGNGDAIISLGQLDGALPQPPKGIFADLEYAGTASGLQKPSLTPNSFGGLDERTGEKRLTWQPRADVRQALVIVRVQSPNSNTYVIAGRNMREVEHREGRLSFMIFVGWIVLLGATFVAKAFAEYRA